MKTTRQIIALSLIMITCLGSMLVPHRARAIGGVGDDVHDFVTEVETTLTSAYNVVSSHATNGLWIKEYVLDPIAWTVAKTMIQQLTNSTVNWINSGFQGSPAFITDPTQFFENIGDQATGALISENGFLTSLCSPISLNVRLAIALDQGAQGGNPYTCTLSAVINNVQGATINGFEAGDFNQGGWQAFAALAEPQNSFYGAYVQAESSLSDSIAKKTQQINNELTQGQGFLTFKKCTDDKSITGDQANQADISGDSSIQYDDKTGVYEKCVASTPGSVLVASLNKQLGANTDSLVTADEIDEVIGALESQLVSQVVGPSGLSGVSQSSNGTPSYVNQIENDVTASNNQEANSLGQSLSSNIGTYIGYASQTKSYEDSSVQIVAGVQASYQSVLSICQNASDTPVVNQIENAIASTTNPLLSQLQAEDAAAAATLANINNLNHEALGATSTDEINAVSQEYTSMLSGNNLPSPDDVQNAENENSQTQTTVSTLTTTAAQYQSECQAYAAINLTNNRIQ